MHDPDQIERIPAAGQPLPVDIPGGASSFNLPPGADRVLTTRQLAWRRFKRHKLAIASAIILVLLGLSTIAVAFISQFGFAEQNLLNRVQGPSSNHLRRRSPRPI